MAQKLLMLCVVFFVTGIAWAQNEEADSAGAVTLTRQWPGPDGNPLPFRSLDQVLDFLKTARIKEMRRTDEGVTGASRVLLEKDGVQMHAVFRDVSVSKQLMQFDSGKVEVGFRDDAIFECAAYQLSRLLSFNLIPPTIQRRLRGKSGTLQAWIEQAVMEKELFKKGETGPDKWLWSMQHQVQRIFDNLIYNVDRNLGNILYTPEWKMILIDHTRSFRLSHDLPNPGAIRYCERSLYESLIALERSRLDARLRPFLTASQIEAIMARRDKLVRHIDDLIEEHGEKDVLFRFYRVENR
jgi:hypothetical protein